MRVKLDEDLSPQVAQPLAARGHDVATVLGQGWGGLADAEIFDRLVSEDVFFITADQGFGDIRAYPPGSHAGILVLRPDRESIVHYRDLLASTLDSHNLAELGQCIAVATWTGVRIRRPDTA